MPQYSNKISGWRKKSRPDSYRDGRENEGGMIFFGAHI